MNRPDVAGQKCSLCANLLLIIILTALSPALAYPRSQHKSFYHISINDGLSQNAATCIMQDSRGFVWIGTTDGLNRYDGSRFEIFRHHPTDENTLSDNYISNLIQDNEGNIWIGTRVGLNCYDPVSKKFNRYKHNPNDSTSLCHDKIQALAIDDEGVLWVGTEGGLCQFSKGSSTFYNFTDFLSNGQAKIVQDVMALYIDNRNTIWIGTFGNGVIKFDPTNKTSVTYTYSEADNKSLSHNFVRTIFRDGKGKLWIGTEKGLNLYDQATNGFMRYLSKNTRMTSDWINAFFEDNAGVLWIGTEGGGLYQYVDATDRFISYQHDPQDENSLSGDRIVSFCEDASHQLWIGTWNSGISLLRQNLKPFQTYRHIPSDTNSLTGNIIYSIMEADDGNIWIGTSSGLNRFNRSNNQFRRYTSQSGDVNINISGIYALAEDRYGNIWLGSGDHGMIQFNKNRNHFTVFPNDPNNPNSLAYNTIWAMLVDRSGLIWIGTAGEGLDTYDPEKKLFKHYRHDSKNENSLSNDTILSLNEDQFGNVWIGTMAGGLCRYDKENDRFIRYPIHLEGADEPFNSQIYDIVGDSLGIYWVASSKGLLRFDPSNEHYRLFTINDGLPNNNVFCILEHQEDQLWMSTNNGLSRFDKSMESFQNYDYHDGLQSNEFNSGASFKGKDGLLYFGGISGFNIFHPDSIHQNNFIPPVVVTDFKLYNNTVSVGESINGRVILEKSITETSLVTLSHHHKVFSLEFAALNFISSEKNAYAYKMENFEKNWNQSGNRNFAAYTNLPPGNYVFRVKGANNDGVWNEKGASLHIRVIPPFWQTTWFRILGLIGAVFFILLFYRFRTKAIIARSKTLEQHVEVRTAELKALNTGLQNEIEERLKIEKKMHDALEEKELLLKEIHHRVKNNMQVISSLLSLQAKHIKDDDTLKLFKVSQDRVRSMALIHEKLYQSDNLARIEMGEYIRSLTEYLFKSYQTLTDSAELEYEVSDIQLSVDKAIPCGLILNELISNALKHGHPSSPTTKNRIKIMLKSEDGLKIQLIVRDNGSGLPEDFSLQQTQSLGLRLVHILATEQLAGEVTINNQAGAEFIISFTSVSS